MEGLDDLIEKYKNVEWKEYYLDFLRDKIREAEKDSKIKKWDYRKKEALIEESLTLNRLDKVHFGIKEFYIEYTNGFFLKWHKNKKEGIGGNIRTISVKDLFEDDLSKFYDEDMIRENKDIQYFRPWDYATPEAQCGFIIKPKEIYASVYYNPAGSSSLHSLDLDYHGYTQMAVEARVYYHWQRVLLHCNGWELGEQETIDFKKHMPEIFPDWTWQNFIDKYERLRLSNKK